MLIFIYFGAWATFSAAGIFNLNVEDKHFSKRKISSSLLWANFTSDERAATAPISSAFAFYNIFAEGPLYDAIVKEQLFVLLQRALRCTDQFILRRDWQKLFRLFHISGQEVFEASLATQWNGSGNFAALIQVL